MRAGAGAPPPPPPPERPRSTTATLLVGLGIVAVALASAAGGVWWRPGSGDVDRGSAFVRGLLGAAIAFGVVGVVLLLNRRHWRRGPRSLVVGAVLLTVALGWLLGLSTGRPATEEDTGRELPGEIDPGDLGDVGLPEGFPSGGISENAGGSFVDADGDGQPDRDRNGNPIIAFDADGDGQYDDGFLVPCRRGEGEPDRSVDGNILLDLSCDGSVDGRIRVSPDLLSGIPGGGLPTDLDLPELAGGDDQSAPNPEESGQDDGGNGDDDGGAWLPSALLTLLIVAGIAVAGGLLLQAGRAWRRRGGGTVDDPEPDPLPPPEAPDIDTRAVDAALASSIETLLGHPDPRVAIRAAYAVLLDALADAGFARLPYEAPEEHLTRCLHGLSVQPEPMRHLLRLFAVARFSTHEVGEADRADALDALRVSQQELRATATASPGKPAAS